MTTKYTVQLLPENSNPYLRHNCVRGQCHHPGKYLINDSKKELQVCLHHASEFCKRYGLNLPKCIH